MTFPLSEVISNLRSLSNAFLTGVPTDVQSPHSSPMLAPVCLFTALASTWIVVHPNMPRVGASKLEAWKPRLSAFAFALFAPELVLLWALRQRYAAQALAQEYRAYGWTMMHGYLLQMGGLVLNEGENKTSVLSESRLFDLLSQQEDIAALQICEDDIRDRCKSDWQPKCLASIQIVAFLFRSAFRFFGGLGLSSLEICTVGLLILHTAIALAWWDKPMNMSFPVYIEVRPMHYVYNKKPTHDLAIQHSNNPEPVARPSLCITQLLSSYWLSITISRRALVDGYHRDAALYGPLGGLIYLCFIRPYRKVTAPMVEMIGVKQDGIDEQFDEEAARSTGTFYSVPITSEVQDRLHLAVALFAALFGLFHYLPVILSNTAPASSQLGHALWKYASLATITIPLLLVVYSALNIWCGSKGVSTGSWAEMAMEFLELLVCVPLFLVGPICYLASRVVIVGLTLVSVRELSVAVIGMGRSWL